MNSERDASVDRLIAGALKARAAAEPAGACLDAETLAAWADGALDARERDAAEAHAADCARCQQLLAAMVRTLPAPVKKSWWRLPTVGWLVPLTAAVTALAIWVAVPRPAVLVQSDGGETAVDQVAPAPRTTAPQTAEPLSDRAIAAPETTAAAPEKDAAAPRPQNEFARTQEALPQAGQVPAEPPAQPLADRRERREIGALEKKESLSAEASNVAPASPVAGAATAAGAGAAAAAAPPASLDAVGQRALSAPSRQAFAARLEVLVVSSNPATRFRLLPGGGVLRSADAGSTWRAEVTGTSETLTAGSSPSPSVCWVVGNAGTVLLSTDGRSWRRVAFPETADLRAVIATDAESATVTTVDGRAFVTTDSGRTWTRPPNP